MNIEEFRIYGKEMVEYICNYLQTLNDRRVTANVEPGYLKYLLPKEAPMKPESFEQIMKDVENKIMPGVTHWQHSGFHAYFPSGNSFPSILADMLSDAIGCIGFSWASSPACTELESIVLDWYAKALNLPSIFLSDFKEDSVDVCKGGGVIQGSASECILVTMLAARSQALQMLRNENPTASDAHFLSRLVAYCSTESHSCVEKAAMICLVKLRILNADDQSSLRGHTLETAILEDLSKGLIPFYVSTTLGTTGCCAFDKLIEIGPVVKRFPGTWLHVDGAYAGNSFICPELRYLMDGIEFADSFNTNPNKWLLVNFDCSCLWVRNRLKLTHALAVDPLYLQHANSAESIDYRHWGIPLSRRFRALKLWFVLRSYGICGLQKYIRNHIMLAKQFENKLRSDNRFEILSTVYAGLVCFRLKDSDEINQDLLANINASGKLHMIPARVKGKYALRFCVVHENANEYEINRALQVISDHANELYISFSEINHNKDQQNPLHKNPNSPMTLDKKLVRKFSFTRSVTRDTYKRSRSKTSLHDGATPITVVEDLRQQVDLIEEDVFCDSR
ncbi:aromatic-L-amino-acid decarboxylase-like [Trichogramma pretiosum]|uniref:aromatic-L-amino-acid decarboxylase-like n=1 Tax=Trichogramma pretiosum TaxID=7493 RepID=UPI0006C97980|nr:aromatic-L-amino-acid decarboxylase-like [Trichogramma pretiosum]